MEEHHGGMTMLETFNDLQGILIGAAIIYAARELRRVSNSIIRLDYRVGDLERMFQSARLREPQRWGSIDDRNEEGGGPSESGG
tara:strand:- start:8 stop:259 length:252 start_codon:yes stop_codon:yes gene_type:complete